ncbi:ABC-type antimicrobial peptide transport system, ATPase component [Rubidibacter lacunae KORDI 51-2]|uniref:ABC-type antimicrobial peptide transport system, ATPase component n=1 Tax=Rubidibacter lacunae KORDI 51-2 TaxID=582515 RepID=U5DR49_9CHRO|nr:ABC transporter ATP-binding protein [Rubidibacter lacunae]ERN42160.1 ABC-type antimicrobial peptide transport system, ATPase component [Rubidibacter lacunae KORDI 51-2]
MTIDTQTSMSLPVASARAELAIRAEGIYKSYKSGRQRVPVLKGIDWNIPRGDVQLLMGPSGSGKTTLISILAGLLVPDDGRVWLLDQDITRMSRAQRTRFRRRHIGFVFQHFNLFPALTAAENIEVVLEIKGIARRRARSEAYELLDRVGLAAQAHQRPRDLSGGQKQRVAIARALAGNPQIAIADEPTAALDAQSGQRIIHLLRQLAKEQGCTVAIVTHDPRITDIADNIFYIEDGSFCAQESSYSMD